jgi:hypothetical protein
MQVPKPIFSGNTKDFKASMALGSILKDMVFAPYKIFFRVKA